MKRKSKKYSKKAGLAPGTLVHIGDQKSESVHITVIDYTSDQLNEVQIQRPEDCFRFKNDTTTTWINIDGLHDTETVEKIGNHFGLHPLLMEDIMNTDHRPKVEQFDDYIFFTLKMLSPGDDESLFNAEQISIILGQGWVISFQEQKGDIFDAIRTRLREQVGQIRSKGSDYLLYRLIDTVVDNYFIVSDDIHEKIENLEDLILRRHEESDIKRIQYFKKGLSALKRATNPLRDATGSLQLQKNGLIKENTIRYINDVHEHVIKMNEAIDAQRDLLNSVMDLYLSGMSNKMNEIMKVLTIIATIFIPLTFIAGIYGMNFDIMPELHWKYGYFIIWGIMAVIFIALILYFKRKRWL